MPSARPLNPNSDGTKFGKSEGIRDLAGTSADETVRRLYQFWVNTDDSDASIGEGVQFLKKRR